MLTKNQQINRRVGRLEALATDLGQLKPGYQPTEPETTRARELHDLLVQVYDLGLEVAPPPPPGQGPEVQAKGKPGKK